MHKAGKFSEPAGRSIGAIAFMAVLALGIVGCVEPAADKPSPFPEPQQSATATDVWLGLFSRTPHPNTTALPEPILSPVDGTYAKVDPSPPQWWACRRCADYRPAGGPWKLSFDRGIMRIFYEIPLWRSIASFEIDGDRMYIFNDTTCPHDVGMYSWEMDDRSLSLAVIEDPCSFGLRAGNLTSQPWNSCLPPNDMVAASDHWHNPPGCDADYQPEPLFLKDGMEFTVNVHGALAREMEVPPEVAIAANPAHRPNVEGVIVTSSADAIQHGRNLVLWKEGDWVEVSTELPFTGMGVQIHGDHTIGWASVFFDGVEVWRGDTFELWSHHGRHGGYIEITDYEPGPHTLRVETLAIDHRPVTIELFGFGAVRGSTE